MIFKKNMKANYREENHVAGRLINDAPGRIIMVKNSNENGFGLIFYELRWNIIKLRQRKVVGLAKRNSGDRYSIRESGCYWARWCLRDFSESEFIP